MAYFWQCWPKVNVLSRVRVATMTHDHDNTPHASLNITSGTCWKVSEVIDFNLRNGNRNLSACFSALIYDFSQFNKIPLSKMTKTRVLQIFANLSFMESWKWGKWAIYKFICLEILFLLIHHTQLSCEIRNKKWFLKLLSIWNTEQIVTMIHFFKHD